MLVDKTFVSSSTYNIPDETIDYLSKRMEFREFFIGADKNNTEDYQKRVKLMLEKMFSDMKYYSFYEEFLCGVHSDFKNFNVIKF